MLCTIKSLLVACIIMIEFPSERHLSCRADNVVYKEHFTFFFTVWTKPEVNIRYMCSILLYINIFSFILF